MSLGEASIPAWLGLIIALGSVGGIVATWFRGIIATNKDRADFKAEIEKRITEVEKKQIISDTRVNIFWQVVEKELPKILLRQHTPEIDNYLRKNMREGLSLEEKKSAIKEMRKLINESIDKSLDDDVRLGYLLYIGKWAADIAEQRVKEEMGEGKYDCKTSESLDSVLEDKSETSDDKEVEGRDKGEGEGGGEEDSDNGNNNGKRGQQRENEDIDINIMIVKNKDSENKAEGDSTIKDEEDNDQVDNKNRGRKG